MVAWLLEVAGAGQVRGEVAAVARRRDPVLTALDDQRRDAEPGSASRTSISLIIRSIRRTALGLAAIRSQRARDRRAASEPARLGAYHSMLSPCPQRRAARSSSALAISSVCSPHG